jgi:hypothetical protein
MAGSSPNGRSTSRLVLDAEFAKSRAGIVIGDAAVITGLDRLDAHHVHQERHQFVTAAGEVLGPGLHGRIVIEQARIVMTEHPGAGPRRCHHGVVVVERRDHLRRDRSSRGAVSAIVGRLAAADLQGRHLDRAAGSFKQLDRGETDRRPEQIDEAGNEKRNAARTGTGAGQCMGHGRQDGSHENHVQRPLV